MLMWWYVSRRFREALAEQYAKEGSGAAALAARHKDRAACVADHALGDAPHEPALYGA